MAEVPFVNCKKHGLVRGHANGKNNYPRCSKCSIAREKKCIRSGKAKAVAYKGGCCALCGYSKSFAALEFHHLNPDEKDFTLSHSKYHKWESLKNELDKCVLLCANCHREEHERLSGD